MRKDPFLNKDSSTDFRLYLKKTFNDETQSHVCDLLARLQLPEPIDKSDYINGCEGALIFLNDYAMTLKIEPIESKEKGLRISDEKILQPVFHLMAGTAVVELYPGVDIEGVTDDDLDIFVDKLAKNGIDFLDPAIRNVGRLPIYNEEFPEGIPVVIDRLSVGLLSTASQLKGKLNNAFYEDNKNAQTEQFKLYEALYISFQDAYDKRTGVADPEKIRKSWALCRSFNKSEKSMAGWMSNEVTTRMKHPLRSNRDFPKTGIRDASLAYAKLF